MWLIFLLLQAAAGNPYQQDCGQFFHPKNYMEQLPSLQMPYVANFPYNMPSIKPSSVQPTKVFNIVTKYVYRNPVCIKISGKKTVCKSNDPKQPPSHKLVTKELFVRDREAGARSLDAGDYLEASETFDFEPKNFQTPLLSSKVKELLIEDRLDQLETILPHYKRRRIYQTSTITVTRVRNNNRAMATLLVKNCIPQGYDLCPPKVKKRKSKVAQMSNATSDLDRQFFG